LKTHIYRLHRRLQGAPWRVREPFNGLSHLAGAGLSAVGAAVLLWLSLGRPLHLAAFAVYGVTLVGLFLASTLYHSLDADTQGLRRLLMMDQVAIYLVIAGTYTPICLVSLRGAWGWSLLAVVWSIALVGVTLRVGWRAAPPWFCVALYLVLGWLCVVALEPITRALPAAAIGWLLLGGLAYTVGVVIVATRRPRLWPGLFSWHELWHVFVLAGSACHFVMMAQYVLPAP